MLEIGLFSKTELENIKSKTKEVKKINKQDIAIIGFSGKFGSLNNVNEFWELLSLGGSTIRDFPKNRLDLIDDKVREDLPWEQLIPAGYFDSIDTFDYEFFNLSLKESRTIDPSQRILLETIWSTLEHASYGGEQIKGTNTGVFIGYSNDHKDDYYNYLKKLDSTDTEEISLTGNVRSVLASRISYLLDLKGPSLVVDTACSSSLTAIHLACKSILSGECSMAIAGGVNVDILPIKKGLDDVVGIRSPHNMVRTFDDYADGIASGEGVGALLLKTLEQAETDGDSIYAVIKSSAINQDGNSIGLTAPNSSAQADAMVTAWNKAKINPETISYIETHGTGTKLGDPIEIEGIEKAFRKFTNNSGFCAVGSVKTNIGHLDAAAGIGSIFKAILMLTHKKLVPSLNFTRPNHNIDFIKSPVYVCDSFLDWNSKDGRPLRCGINSFGLSGTNCHLLLEEYCKKEKIQEKLVDVKTKPDGGKIKPEELNHNYIFTLSAKDENLLYDLVKKYKSLLKQNNDMEVRDLCYSSNIGRKHFDYRLAIIVNNKKDLNDQLDYFLKGTFPKSGNDDANLYYGHFKFVSFNKNELLPDEINDSKIRELSKEAKELLDACNESNEGNKSNACINSDILKNICKLYIKGATIEWNDFYKGELRKKLPLPTYPFKRTSCWHKKNENIKKGNFVKNYPLLNGEAIESLNESIYITYLNKNNWVIGEHIVDGNCVLPGTAYAEILVEILKLRKEWKHGIKIKKLTFMNQFMVDQTETKALHTILKKADGEYQFTMASKNKESFDWTIHAEGTIEVIGQEESKTVDMASLLKNKKKEIIQVQFNEVVDIGKHWKSIDKHIYEITDCHIVAFDMAEEFKQEVKRFAFYPSLMDRGMNATIDILKEKEYYLPFNYEELILLKELPDKFYSLVKVNEYKGEEIVLLDVMICDDRGEVFAIAHNYAVKRTIPKNRIEEKVHPMVLRWKPCPIRIEQISSFNKLMIFGNYEDVKKVAAPLKDKGNEITKVILASESKETARDTNTFYIQDNRSWNQIATFIKEEEINHIIYVSSNKLENAMESLDSVNYVKQLTLDSIFYFIKALVHEKMHKKVRLLFLLKGAYEVLETDFVSNPFHTSLAALRKVISMEYSNIETKVIDYDEIANAESIQNELWNDFKSNEIAYRNHIRYEQVIEDYQDIKNYEKKEQNYNAYKKDGIYAITGGTGALGLECAKYLAKQAPIQIALLSRSAMEERSKWSKNIIATVEEIESNGASVVFKQVDVSNYERLKQCLEELRNEHHRINGLIHCAGIVSKGLIMNEEKSSFDEVLASKVNGTVYLDLLTRGDKPDFTVYFSSINAITGGIGQGDYAAANAFMDGYSYYRNSLGLKTISINWPGWKEVGMAKEHNAFHKDDLMEGISTSDAMKWLGRMLNTDLKNTIIAKYNRTTENQKEVTQNKSDKVQISSLTSVQKRMSDVWSRVMEIEEIDIFESFSHMGGDSIMATYLYKAVEAEFPNMIDITDIFSYPTVHAMAELIESKMEVKKPKKEDDLDILLGKLANGSITIEEMELLYNGGES